MGTPPARHTRTCVQTSFGNGDRADRGILGLEQLAQAHGALRFGRNPAPRPARRVPRRASRPPAGPLAPGARRRKASASALPSGPRADVFRPFLGGQIMQSRALRPAFFLLTAAL